MASRKHRRRYSYMHTLDNRPAHYNGEQIIYADRTVRLVDSLKQIHRERALSEAWRKKRGWPTGGCRHLKVQL